MLQAFLFPLISSLVIFLFPRRAAAAIGDGQHKHRGPAGTFALRIFCTLLHVLPACEVCCPPQEFKGEGGGWNADEMCSGRRFSPDFCNALLFRKRQETSTPAESVMLHCQDLIYFSSLCKQKPPAPVTFSKEGGHTVLNVAQSKQHFLKKQEVRELLANEIPRRVTVRPDPPPSSCSVPKSIHLLFKKLSLVRGGSGKAPLSAKTCHLGWQCTVKLQSQPTNYCMDCNPS